MPESERITVIGGGPAGASAAIAAATLGAAVTVVEPSRLPRHRVCGEFLSPEIVPFLDRLGVWRDCAGAPAPPVRRMVLRFSRTSKTARLAEPAFALSRFALDRILLDRAATLGATVVRQRDAATTPVVQATGRPAARSQSRRNRLFGFKAHFAGPVDDAVELYFAPGLYVGVNAVEGQKTNICGLAGEAVLASFGFDFDAVCASIPALAARVQPLARCWKWLTTGPVEFRRPARSADALCYPAGDALSFVDPFTGTGITNAVITGTAAGRAAARGGAVADYLADCANALSSANRWAATFRTAVQYGVAEYFAPFVPASALVRLTRPRAADLLF